MCKIFLYTFIIFLIFFKLQGQNEGIYKDLNTALSDAEKVKVLILKNKKLEKLTSKIDTFQNLEVLVLKRNKLNSLPENIINCKK